MLGVENIQVRTIHDFSLHAYSLVQFANFSCKGTDKYFRLFRPYGLSHNYTTLPLKCKSSHQQYIYERDWVPIKLYLKNEQGLVLIHVLLFTDL